jgi:hypothetical protein
MYPEKMKNINQHIKMNAKDIIKLNVGGTLFETTKTTLRGSIFLTALVSREWNKNQSGEFFIDRSPEKFREVLEVLRGNGANPNKEELKWYGIDYEETPDEMMDLVAKALCPSHPSQFLEYYNELLTKKYIIVEPLGQRPKCHNALCIGNVVNFLNGSPRGPNGQCDQKHVGSFFDHNLHYGNNYIIRHGVETFSHDQQLGWDIRSCGCIIIEKDFAKSLTYTQNGPFSYGSGGQIFYTRIQELNYTFRGVKID